MWETVLLNRLHIFSLPNSISFLYLFLKSKFLKNNSLPWKKFLIFSINFSLETKFLYANLTKIFTEGLHRDCPPALVIFHSASVGVKFLTLKSTFGSKMKLRVIRAIIGSKIGFAKTKISNYSETNFRRYFFQISCFLNKI